MCFGKKKKKKQRISRFSPFIYLFILQKNCGKNAKGFFKQYFLKNRQKIKLKLKQVLQLITICENVHDVGVLMMSR